jgi:hypothetical protein
MSAVNVPPIECVPLPDRHELGVLVAELYAAHHVLRSFGLPASDLYVLVGFVPNESPPGHYVCVKAVKGSSEAIFALRPVEHEWQWSISEAWGSFVRDQLPRMSESQLEQLVNGTVTRGRATAMALVLAKKGMLAHLDPEVS